MTEFTVRDHRKWYDLEFHVTRSQFAVCSWYPTWIPSATDRFRRSHSGNPQSSSNVPRGKIQPIPQSTKVDHVLISYSSFLSLAFYWTVRKSRCCLLSVLPVSPYPLMHAHERYNKPKTSLQIAYWATLIKRRPLIRRMAPNCCGLLSHSKHMIKDEPRYTGTGTFKICCLMQTHVDWCPPVYIHVCA